MIIPNLETAIKEENALFLWIQSYLVILNNYCQITYQELTPRHKIYFISSFQGNE